MLTFKVHFSRYRDGSLRISTPTWLHGLPSFRDASSMAEMMLRAMQGADPHSAYATVEISTQVHGTQCDGANMFETQEELTARLADKATLA